MVPVRQREGAAPRAWVEGNRRQVDELSGGKLAYVWVPEHRAAAATRNFNRYYFAQQDKQGAVIDERFNHGGARRLHGGRHGPRLRGFFNNPVGDATLHRAQRPASGAPR